MTQPSPWSTQPGDDPFAAAREALARRIAAEQTRGPSPIPGGALDEVLAEVADLRPLPQVAQRILALDEHQFSAHELAAIISTDQALTAKLLRLANSPYYGFARRITSARDAVVLLGFRSVRSAALTSCLMQTAKGSQNLNTEAFWQFAIATGILAEVLARTEGAHQDEAFTAGVLHQIGLLALDQGRPEALASVLERQAQGVSLSTRSARSSASRTRSSAARSRCTGTSRRHSRTPCAATRSRWTPSPTRRASLPASSARECSCAPTACRTA